MEADVSAIRARIEVVDNRLTALTDHGVDTAGLRSRLTQARDLLETGEPADALALTDEVATGVRQLATGAARSSGEVRSIVRDQLVGEVRDALAGGAAHEVVEQRLQTLRGEINDRLTHFERHLRDQFARELAQVVAARPWMKDILSHPGDPATLRTAIEAVLSARPAATPESSVRGGVEVLRDQVSGLRRRVEVALGASAPEDRLQQALEAIAASEEGMTDLVANIAEVQAQMGDRVLQLERKIAELTRLATQQSLPLTRQTTLHVEDPLVVPAPGATVIAPAPDEEPLTLPPPTGSKAWPFGDESSLSAPAISTADVAALMQASTSDVPIDDRPRARPAASALTHGDTARALPGEASTGDLRMTPQQVTTDIRRAERRAVDEPAVRRLIEERLAAWQPVPGEGLVSDDEDVLAQLIRMLPKALNEGSVRTALFATLALEAIEKPGALAHLSRLRDFLREELGLAVEQLRGAATSS